MSEDLQRSFNHAHSNNFLVICSRIRTALLRAVSVNVPGYSLQSVTIDNPVGIENQPGNVWIPDDLVFTFIVDENWEAYFEIFKWMIEAKRADEEELKNIVGDVTVSFLDNHHQTTAIAFQYTGAYPASINSFSADSNTGSSNEILVSVVMKYSDVKISLHKGETVDDTVIYKVR